jgi:hypothetical protein
MLPELLRGTLASLDSCRLEGERSTGRQLHHFERGFPRKLPPQRTSFFRLVLTRCSRRVRIAAVSESVVPERAPLRSERFSEPRCTTALSSGLVGYWTFDGPTLNWNTDGPAFIRKIDNVGRAVLCSGIGIRRLGDGAVGGQAQQEAVGVLRYVCGRGFAGRVASHAIRTIAARATRQAIAVRRGRFI